MVEAGSEEAGIDLSGYGSWTVKDKSRERGLEPDECYVLGELTKPRPDLAIEVVISSGSLDKLEVYRQMGIPEVWFWRRSGFTLHVLRGDCYAEVPRSEVLPTLDLGLLARFVDHPIRQRRCATTAAYCGRCGTRAEAARARALVRPHHCTVRMAKHASRPFRSAVDVAGLDSCVPASVPSGPRRRSTFTWPWPLRR